MSKQEVEKLLIAGGEDKKVRAIFDSIDDKERFVEKAKSEGYDFTIAELDEVLKESGDSFDSFGNPRKKAIWWQ